MRRYDLQAIRGVAILLVLSFHLQPLRFPLGFVGVDMFFVLSGFLMALILSKENMACNTFQEFYIRRFKRIVPVYYIILLAVFIGCAFILAPLDKDQLLSDLKWSFPFASNIQQFSEEKGYWDQVIDYRFLVHCWSLGVEIQFYVIAPFIITATNKFRPYRRFLSLTILIIFSILFQLFTPENISYDLLPSRLWQFFLGVLCFNNEKAIVNEATEKKKLLEDSNKGSSPPQIPVVTEPGCTKRHTLSECALGLLIVAVATNPHELLTEKCMRLLGSFVICLVIRWPAPQSYSFLSNYILIYIGDLSYTMYLVHWPIIVATKYYYNINSFGIIGLLLLSKNISFSETLLLFCVIFFVTMIIHYVIEKPLISCSVAGGLLVCIVCVSSVYILKPYYNNCCIGETPEFEGGINITAAIEFNLYEAKKNYYPIHCDPDNTTSAWNNWTKEPELRCQTYANGTLKILVIGNSIAYRAFPLIKEVLKGRYKELRLFSKSASPPLSDKNPEFTAAAHIVADKMKPDFIWHIHCEFDDIFIRPFLNKSTDPVFLSFQKHLDFYMTRTKLIIIDLPYYWANIEVCYELVRRLQLRRSVEDLKISREEAEKQQKHHQARLLALNCSDCVFNHVEDTFWKDDTYSFYNRENYFGYTKEGNHFTPEFLETRLKPLYEKTVQEVLRRLEAQKSK